MQNLISTKLPKNYVLNIGSHQLIETICHILYENNYTRISKYDLIVKDSAFIIVPCKYKLELETNDYLKLSNNKYYTISETFYNMAMPTRSIEYSKEEILNLENMLLSADMSTQYFAAKIISRMASKYLKRFIIMYPHIFLNFSIRDEDYYIRMTKFFALQIDWGLWIYE